MSRYNVTAFEKATTEKSGHAIGATTIDYGALFGDLEEEEEACWRPYFGNNTEHFEIFNKNRGYYLIIPSAIIIISLAFVQARKHLCLNFLKGRPSVPYPLNIIENRDDRFSLVMGFVFTTWTLLGVIFGTVPFDWDFPSNIKSLMLMLGSLILGLLFYPIFGTFSAKNIIIYAMGTFYMWLQYAMHLIMTWPCKDSYSSTVGWVFYWASLLPVHIFFILLGLMMPIRAIQIFLLRKRRKTGNYLSLQSFIFYYIISATTSGWLREVMDIEHESPKRMMILSILGINSTQELLPYLKEVLYWTDALSASIFVSIMGSVILTSGSLLLSLRNYRKHLLYLYRGIYKNIPRQSNYSPRSIVVHSTKYVGYQFGYAAWGYILQAGVLLILTLLLSIFIIIITRYNLYDILLEILKQVWPIFVYLTALVIFQHLIVQFVFLLRGTDGRKVLGLDNRRLFFNFQFFMIFANAPLGFFSCLFRIIKGVIFGLITIPRLDVSTLSRQFERFDNGFAAYVSMLQLDNAMTNPVMLVFINLLIESIRHQPTCSERNIAFLMSPTDEKVGKKSSKVPSMHCDLARSKLIRNRWHLFVTLHNNIALRALRYHTLPDYVYDSSFASSVTDIVSDSPVGFSGNGPPPKENNEKNVTNIVIESF